MGKQFLRFKRVPLVFVFSVIIFSITSITESAEFRILPSVTLSEEYNDNVFLANEDTVSEYITRAQPSIMLEFEGLMWELDIDYGLDYRYFAKGTRVDRTTHNLAVDGRLEILRELFFFDISNEYRRVSLDITRDFARESLFVNQSDRNMFSANPYFVLRPHSLITINVGYIFEDVWYKEERGIDRRHNIGYINSVYEVSSMLTLNADYKYTNAYTDLLDYDKHDIGFGPRYEYAEESFIFFTVGNSWLDLGMGDNSSRIFWNAGITHTFPLFTGTLESVSDYIEDPRRTLRIENRYIASISKTLERTSFLLSIYLREYRNFQTEDLEIRRYGTEVDLSYEITPRLTGNLDFIIEKLEREIEDTYTRRYIPRLGVDYKLLEDLTLTFIYQYIYSDSPKVEESSYKNNRFTLAMRKSF